MPIYMDRHNLSATVTAENVAQIHQEDLKVQSQYGCRGLTYWFDDVRKTAFCLFEAPNEEALKEMHRVAHGDVPHLIIEVAPAIVASFLGRIEDPVKAQDNNLNIINDPAFRTIMVMVLQEAMHGQNELATFKKSLNKFYAALPGILKSYAGTMVKQGNDHFLISFNSVSNGVHAAIDLHALYKHFTRASGSALNQLKTGLCAGVPVTEKKFIFEDCIRLAERMCAVMIGDIIISSEVKDLYNSENIKAVAEDQSLVALSGTDEQFLNRLMEYTEEKWNDVNLKADDFCKPLGCSKSQLYRKMTTLTGKSPNLFIKEYRLARALSLLNNGTGNISEIAFEAGFSSPSYFSKCFQKRYGHSPSDHIPVRAALQIQA